MQIYKITNKVNGKIYIGQTINSIKKRLRDHKALSSGSTYLKNAMNAYGRVNFEIESIHTCESPEDMNYWEKYYINYYKSNNPEYGYNIKQGGHREGPFVGIDSAKSILSHKIIDSNGVVYDSINQAKNKTGLSRDLIFNCLKDGKPTTGKAKIKGICFYYIEVDSFQTEYNKTRKKIQKQRKLSLLVDSFGVQYVSVIQASEITGISQSKIRWSIDRGKSVDDGLNFYKLDQNNEPIIIEHIKQKSTRIYTKGRKASEETKQKQSFSLKGKKKNLTELGKIIQKENGRKTAEKLGKPIIDQDGIIYRSILEASKILDIERKSIRNLLKSGKASPKGISFKFVNNK